MKSVYANSERDGDKAGAIAGLLNAGTAAPTIKDCKAVNCEISAVRDAGQVVGCAKADKVTDCTATNVTVSAISGQTNSVNNVRNEIIGRVAS